MKNKKHEPTREEILNTIGDCFQQIYQWCNPANVDFCENMVKYQHQADALIELLEVHDTGSCLSHTGSLWKRFVKRYNQYNDITNKRFGCDISSFKDLNKFFTLQKVD